MNVNGIPNKARQFHEIEFSISFRKMHFELSLLSLFILQCKLPCDECTRKFLRLPDAHKALCILYLYVQNSVDILYHGER